MSLPPPWVSPSDMEPPLFEEPDRDGNSQPHCEENPSDKLHGCMPARKACRSTASAEAIAPRRGVCPSSKWHETFPPDMPRSSAAMVSRRLPRMDHVGEESPRVYQWKEFQMDLYNLPHQC